MESQYSAVDEGNALELYHIYIPENMYDISIMPNMPNLLILTIMMTSDSYFCEQNHLVAMPLDCVFQNWITL
jgi:type IV secretory pathway VirB6-like protein